MKNSTNLKFSHFCGKIRVGELSFPAYYLNNDKYRIVKQIDETESPEYRDIKIEDYQKLPSSHTSTLNRFRAVEGLFR